MLIEVYIIEGNTAPSGMEFRKCKNRHVLNYVKINNTQPAAFLTPVATPHPPAIMTLHTFGQLLTCVTTTKLALSFSLSCWCCSAVHRSRLGAPSVNFAQGLCGADSG
jgi:hypothetical protein